ncbi:MAG: PilZ domain-containing protein [Steroidobacteraceae bacterium]|jgi:hypothetical protein
MGFVQMLEVLTMEHRWGKRISVDVPIRLRCRACGMAEGRIVNLSVSGALIRTNAALSLLAQVEILLDDGILPSYVTRIDGNGVGVEWCEPSRDIRAMILRARPAMGRQS